MTAPPGPRRVGPTGLQRAIVQHRYGDAAEVLADSAFHAIRPPAAGEVQIRVHAVALNPIDWQMIEGNRKLISRRVFPFVPLFDLAGVVVAVGDHVTRFRPGDGVHADNEARGGGASEFVNVLDELVSLMPDRLTFAEAAALPLAAQTALLALEQGGVGAASRVAIVGASGGVGNYAVQIAKALGAAHVVGVCSARNEEFVRSLGADATIDHTTTTLLDALPGRRLDVVLDCVGGRDQWLQARKVLRPGGTFATIARDEDGVVTVASAARLIATIFWRRLASSWGDRIRYVPVFLRASHKLLDRVDDLVRAGQLHVHLQTRRNFSLESLLALIDESKTGRTVGKLVLDTVPDGEHPGPR